MKWEIYAQAEGARRIGERIGDGVWVEGCDKGAEEGATGVGEVKLGGIVVGEVELLMPELGRRQIVAGEWYVLGDSGGRTQVRWGCGSVGLEVELQIEELMAGVGIEVLQGRLACLGCPVRDVAYFAKGRNNGRMQGLLAALSGSTEMELSGVWRRRSQLAEWIACILDQPECTGGSCCCTGVGQGDLEAIEAVALELRENLAEAHTIGQLARKFFVNECKLKALFRRHFGTTIQGYLRQQRMQHARELLENGGCGVMAAAVEVGYSNASHFARAFREVHGINPGEVRLRSANRLTRA